MNKLKRLIITFTLLAGVGFVALPAAPALAVNVYDACDTSDPANETAVCQGRAEQAQPVVQAVVNTLLYVVGIISVLVIIVAGIMYATSAGDAAAVGKAKGALLYAVIGLVVAFLAYAIVNWVLGRIG